MDDRTFDCGIIYTAEDIEDRAVNIREDAEGWLIADADCREYWFRPHDWGYMLDHSWIECIVSRPT